MIETARVGSISGIKYVAKKGDAYVVQKWISDKCYHFGSFHTVQAAMKVVDKMGDYDLDNPLIREQFRKYALSYAYDDRAKAKKAATERMTPPVTPNEKHTHEPKKEGFTISECFTFIYKYGTPWQKRKGERILNALDKLVKKINVRRIGK